MNEYTYRRAQRAVKDAQRTQEAIQFTVDNPGHLSLVVEPNNYKQWYRNGKKISPSKGRGHQKVNSC